MKKYLNRLLVIFILGMSALTSCKKQIAEVYYEGGTAPVLSANLKDTIPLSAYDSSNVALIFSYTNPNYLFSDGISSQNVVYSLQVDTLGSNFSNFSAQQITGNLNLNTPVTVGYLNQLLASKLGLSLNKNHKIQVRLVTSLGTNSQAQLVSNTLVFNVTPYSPPPLITPPTTGTLFIVGSAVAGGWSNPIDPANLTAQQFTQVSPTEYKITIPLIGAGEYKLIAKSGSWGEQWSVSKTDDPAAIYGGSFVSNGNNTLAPPASDIYDIYVNFQNGKFTVSKH